MRTLCLLLLLGVCLFVAFRLAASSLVTVAPAAGMSAASSSAAVGVPASSSSFSLLGRPTVSASFIDRVLTAYHSPALGIGQALYADGVQSGIDPVFPLAFFLHESSFGTQGIARLTHSLGNIRCSSGYACLDGFRAYPSWTAGAADWFALMRSVYLPAGRSSVPTIISMYAPSSENDTSAYIAAVEQAVTVWRSGSVLV